jgi:chorismate-pyruvate lyase
MADLNARSEHSKMRGEVLDFMHGLVFDMLLVTDGRTTDLLETMLNEKTHVSVIRQEQMNATTANPLLPIKSSDAIYRRESILISEKSQLVVSHNVAFVHSKHVPPSLFEKIAYRQEGIGKAISSIGLQSFRDVIETGFKEGEEAVDRMQQSIQLHFPELHDRVPYKKYDIYFGLEPGIEMIEYFNPDIIKHRLKQVMNEINGGINHE